MNVTIERIDDRLIHGQIVVSWLSYAEAKSILVADDKAAGDEMQQMLLKLAVPSGVTLHIETLENACRRLLEEESSEKTLLILRNPKEALRLLEMGYIRGVINVGNISNFKSDSGRKNILDYFNPEEADVTALRMIAERGITLDLRAIPTEKSKNAIELLNKYF